MGRDNSRDGDRAKRAAKVARLQGRARTCAFCTIGVARVDYKDANLLQRFLSDRGKIRARRVSGNCAQHQREVAVAIKTAREVALLPYAQRPLTERGQARGARRGHAPPATPGPARSGVAEQLVANAEQLVANGAESRAQLVGAEA